METLQGTSEAGPHDSTGPSLRPRLLQVLAVLLLIPFHSARVFDVWDDFYVKNADTSEG
jgi:hypothetical protein